jgi:predicted nucleic acid-binding protein
MTNNIQNSILLDKNVALDIISGRPRRPKILEMLKNYDCHFISTNTFTTCFYVLRREKLSKEQIYSYLMDFEILEIDKNDCYLAYNLAQNIEDIEDCLELFTAKRNSCKMMTSDQKMTAKYNKLFQMIEI